MNEIPVVIMRANDNCFLDCIRACGTADIPIIPVIFTWEGAEKWNSESSKYFYNAVEIPNPASNEIDALEAMIALGKDLLKKYKQKVLIIASSDTNLYFLQKHFDALKKYFLQMGHDDFTVDCIREFRKDTSACLLKEKDVDIPLTFPVLNEADIEVACENITFPCVYKPVLKDLTSSFQNTHNKKKAIECFNQNELRKKLKLELENGYELIVQEKIEFSSLEDEVSCYVYVDKDKNIRMISGQHKIIEHPHPYGTGVVSVPFYEEEFYSIAEKIVSAYNWRGFLGIEFMKNLKTNKWVVIEINLRPWLSVNYQAMLGFNYIAMLYQDYYGGLPEFSKPLILKQFETVRVNLSLLIKKYMFDFQNETAALRACYEYIENNVGNIIFSYMIKEDVAPGEGEEEMLLQKYPKNQEIIEKIFELVRKNNKLYGK